MKRTDLTRLLSLLSLTLSVAQASALRIATSKADGHYTIGSAELPVPVVTAPAAIEANGVWIYASDYPNLQVTHSSIHGELGLADQWTVTYSGRPELPELILCIRGYHDRPFGGLQILVKNTTGETTLIDALRPIDAGADAINLAGSHGQERVLSDSFSENRPAHDAADALCPPFQSETYDRFPGDPVAQMTASKTGQAGEDVAFDAGSGSEDTPILEYH